MFMPPTLCTKFHQFYHKKWYSPEFYTHSSGGIDSLWCRALRGARTPPSAERLPPHRVTFVCPHRRAEKAASHGGARSRH